MTAVDEEKIGAAPHVRRNRWLVVGLVGATVVVGAYYLLLGHHDALQVARLEQFRAAYAQKCHAPRFAEPTPPMLKELFLGSTVLQAVVDRQLTALDSGASCEGVSQALRAADFPIPAT